MAIFNKRARFTREQLLDHYLKRNSIVDILYTIVRVLGIIVQNLYCISSYLVLSWLVLLPINWLKSDLYSRLENYLYNSLLFIVSSWSLAAGLTVVESGDEFKHLIEEADEFEELHETAADDKFSLKQYNSITRNISNNKRYLDDLLNSNQRNAFTAKNTRLNDRNGVYTRNEFKNHLVTGSILSSTEFLNSSVNEHPKGVVNGLFKATQINKSINNNDQYEKGDFIGSRFDEHQEQDLLITAETNKMVNLNNISENKDINAEKNIRLRNGTLKRNTRESVLSTRVMGVGSNEIRQDTLKNIQYKPRILFLCNHISTADVPLIMQSFSTLTNQSILWVLDAQFKITNFGVVCGSHGDFFVAKNSFVDGSLQEHVLKYADRNLLVLFPEGGFLRKRIDGSNRYATRNNLPLTRYVTHPRFGAFKDLIDPSVGVTHIVDATLMYDDINNPPSILDIVFGNKKEPAVLHYKVYKRSEINPTEEWLRNIWLEKDKLLNKYYEDRASVLKRNEDSFRVASLDWFKILSVHLFFFLVCYLTMFRLFNATSVTMLKARELYYSNI